MQYKTFKQWRNSGFHVIKGEKSDGRNVFGEPVFSRNKVEKDKKKTFRYSS